MKRLLLCLAATGLLLAAVGPPAPGASDKLKVGEAVPEFTLPRVDHTGSFGTAQLRGKPAAVLFWRPGQRLSEQAIEDLEAVAAELGAGQFGAVLVDAGRSTAEQVQKALGSGPVPFPVVLDPERTLYGGVGVIVSPTTLLVDAEGVLRFSLASRPRQFRHVLRARLRFLLGVIDQRQMEAEIEPTVLHIDSDLAAAWRMFSLGKQLQAEGKAGEALALYQQAVEREPSMAEAHCELGYMQLASGTLGRAEQHFRTALEHKPTLPAARLGIAAVLSRTGDPEQAEQLLLSLLGRESIAARVRYELGRLYRARGELDKAVSFYQDALARVFPEAGGERIDLPAAASPGAAALPAGARDPLPDPAAGAAARWEAVQPRTAAPDIGYLGVKACKKCHFQQWKSWRDTPMAKAFALLQPGQRAAEKRARQLDPSKDYSGDSSCLQCHTTGYGHAGGYSAGSGERETQTQGVGCEACHGPGERFAALHKDVQDKKRPYASSEFEAAGQFPVDESVCAACHRPNAPCIDPKTPFDFATRRDEGTHKHHELQFRSK